MVGTYLQVLHPSLVLEYRLFMPPPVGLPPVAPGFWAVEVVCMENCCIVVLPRARTRRKKKEKQSSLEHITIQIIGLLVLEQDGRKEGRMKE